MTCWFYPKVKKSRNDRHDIRFIIKFKYRLSCRRYRWAYLGHGCDSRRLHQMKTITLIFISKFFSLVGEKREFGYFYVTFLFWWHSSNLVVYQSCYYDLGLDNKIKQMMEFDKPYLLLIKLSTQNKEQSNWFNGSNII